jgi:hypothetical protein
MPPLSYSDFMARATASTLKVDRLCGYQSDAADLHQRLEKRQHRTASGATAQVIPSARFDR